MLPLDLFGKHKRLKDGLNTYCKPCQKQKALEYRINNAASVQLSKAKYRQKHKEKIAKTQEIYRLANKDKIKAWQSANLLKASISAAKRRAVKQKATPSWANQQKIDVTYEYARLCSIVLKQEFQVDHIVPLQGVTVTGLHVPANLQVIPAKENSAKRNRYWPQMWQ